MIPIVFGGIGQNRYFERGYIKLAIINLIAQRPRHGYDIIQELEEKSHGFYHPSPGTVYPILALMEDQGYIKAEEKDGKKVYSITDDGKKYLEEHEEELTHLREKEDHLKERFGPYSYDIFAEIRDITPLIFRNVRNGGFKDENKALELKTALKDFRERVETIFSKKPGQEE